MSNHRIVHGNCLDVLRDLPDCSLDAVVTDPPYGLSNTDPKHVAETISRWVQGERDYIPTGSGFMGKAWDAFVPPVAVWDECLRVLKPGGHCLVFAGSRTMDLMTLGLRLAGFEIRDSLAWLYGSGFPKSLDVSKAIDKAAGAERERYARPAFGGTFSDDNGTTYGTAIVNTPATPEAQQWAGWGTALKPAFEPVVVARKPLGGTVQYVCGRCQGEDDEFRRECPDCGGSGYLVRTVGSTVAANVLAHGTGALNIDACRVEGPPRPVMVRTATEVAASSMAGVSTGATASGETTTAGRWPANVILDESQAAALDRQSGQLTSGTGAVKRVSSSDQEGNRGAAYGAESRPAGTPMVSHGDTGGASRFFYVAKAPKRERPTVDGVAHPTVKPVALMRWLVRLVTPPGGTVLDPFAGSGTTVEACLLEGFDVMAIEREANYLPLIEARVARQTQDALPPAP